MPSEKPVTLGASPELWLPAEGSVWIAVRGISMRPTLEEGDRVEVRRCAPAELRPGDIAAFSRGGELTVHRAVRVTEERFLEMGDGQERGNWQSWPSVLAVVLAVEGRGGGRRGLTGEEAKRGARTLARRMLRRHRAACFVEALPGALCRRGARFFLRPWLRPPADHPEFSR